MCLSETPYCYEKGYADSYLRSPIRTRRYRLPFLILIRAFLLNMKVSARMVGFVNFANKMPTIQAYNVERVL